jgi:hypothetical protein
VQNVRARALIPIAFAAALLLGGCGFLQTLVTPTQNVRVGAVGRAQCSSFSFRGRPNAPGFSSPAQALHHFLVNDAVPHDPQAGFPMSGWRVVATHARTVVFEVRDDQLIAGRVGQDIWTVYAGSRSSCDSGPLAAQG